MFDKNKVEEYFPEAGNLMIEPMLIKKPKDDAELERACASGDYFGQIKKDGAFYQFVKTQNHAYLFGRTVSVKNGLLTEKGDCVPHIMEHLKEALPPNTILVGEIYYPGKTSKSVTSIMGCLPGKALERQEGSYGYIHYYIHDILMYDGVDFVKAETSSYVRYLFLKKIFEIHNLKTEYIELADIYVGELYAEIAKALHMGEEGMVIKRKDRPYVPGKRPDSNLKAKKTDTADVVILGFEMPTRTYFGKDLTNWEYWINPTNMEPYPIGCYSVEYSNPERRNIVEPVTKAFYMGWNNSRIKVGAWNGTEFIELGTIHSGISDEMKKAMSENPDKYLYQVCSIKMMEKDPIEKTFRHGYFVQMRDDKYRLDCTLDTVF